MRKGSVTIPESILETTTVTSTTMSEAKSMR